MHTAQSQQPGTPALHPTYRAVRSLAGHGRWLAAVPLACLLGLGLSTAPLQGGPVPIKAQSVAGMVHMFEGSGGNIGVSAGPDGILLVDSQFAHQIPLVKEAYAELSEEDLTFLINTHWHGDHTGGNQALSDLDEDLVIVAHGNVRKRMSTEQKGRQPSPRAAWPDMIHENGVSLFFNGEEVRVVDVSGAHTDGDSGVYFVESKVLHLGDTFFNGLFPYIDVSSGGSARGMARRIGEVLDWLPEDAQVIPGHGPLATHADLVTYHAMLVDCIKIIEQGLADGQTDIDMQAAQALKKYEHLSWGFISADKFIQTLAADLAKE